MSARTILEYHEWAKRGYVSPLECYKCELNLIPIEKLDHILLQCPRCSYKKELGLAGLVEIERKIEGSKMIFRMQ